MIQNIQKTPKLVEFVRGLCVNYIHAKLQTDISILGVFYSTVGIAKRCDVIFPIFEIEKTKSEIEV